MDYFIHQQGFDPFFNLALEEYLMTDMPADSRILLLWQSDNAVIMGKHQNPWLECDLDYLRDHNISLARRISGGGAVYHDQGNINFSFIMPKSEHHPEYFSGIIQSALNKLDLPVLQNRRHDLLLEGKKISGNAFSLKRERSLHHGTLLVCTDLQRMACLNGVNKMQQSKSIRSHPSVVTNIQDYKPQMDVAVIIKAIRREWNEKGHDVQALAGDSLDLPKIRAIQSRLESWEWIYGNTPAFSVELDQSETHLTIEVEHAYVHNVQCKTGTLYQGKLQYRFNKNNLQSLIQHQIDNASDLLQGFVF